jgi:hypothetical protein
MFVHVFALQAALSSTSMASVSCCANVMLVHLFSSITALAGVLVAKNHRADGILTRRLRASTEGGKISKADTQFIERYAFLFVCALHLFKSCSRIIC